MEEKKTKLVFSPKVARALCKAGDPIIDIKKSRDNPASTVFVFENTEKFKEDLNTILSNISNIDNKE